METKGTVTPLSSMYPPSEIQKATERVQDAIFERRKQIDQLKHFISDNSNLINLVQTLPNELHHDVMVPFGKAAFFPGRLIHTNELMVLLGEGYYTERTSKQTVEILKRRGKLLESQVESLKAEIRDLKVEANFFNTTASEAEDGLVQITEDYFEETPSQDISEAGRSKADSPRSFRTENTETEVEDEEYQHIFSRIAELEKEEEEAEKANEEDESNEDGDNYLTPNTSQLSLNQDVRSSEVDQSKLLSMQKGISKLSSTEKALELPTIKENPPSPHRVESEVFVPTSERGTHSSSKAFTGSIVEHTHEIEVNPREQTVAHSSKPVSRFKMRRQ